MEKNNKVVYKDSGTDWSIETVADAVEARFSKVLDDKLVPYNKIVNDIQCIQSDVEDIKSFFIMKKPLGVPVSITFIILFKFIVLAFIIAV
jgi:hypothetical protein